MRISQVLQSLALVGPVFAQVQKGFNYGATYTDGSAVRLAGFEAQFRAAQNLVGTSGFASARLFTSVQAGTTNTPSEAFQAAINTKTTLLLGIWGSGGPDTVRNEIAAISAAVENHGTTLTDLIIAISVGSEDLYRISPTGIINKSGIGAGPAEVSAYISQVKQAITNDNALKILSGKPIGHVDTWTAWVNSSNSAVIAASDFIGMDAYPYFQSTMTNDIRSAYDLFFEAYDQTVAAAGGKQVWVTETGWPVSGPKENLAQPSIQNAQDYWRQVGCGRLFGNINTWWYTLQDTFPKDSSPSFGIVGRGSSSTDVPTLGLFELGCSAKDSSVLSSSQIPSATFAETQVAQPSSTIAVPSQVIYHTVITTCPSTVIINGQTSTVKTTRTIVVTACPGGCASATATALLPAGPSTLSTVVGAPPKAVATGCPADLNGPYEYPHLIVPVDSKHVDSAGGTSYNGKFSNSVSTIFNFDIPKAYDGKTCSLIFFLPKLADLETSSYTISGAGGLNVAQLKEAATEATSFANKPSIATDLQGPSQIMPGNSYVISSTSCQAGARISYLLSSTGDLDLQYFQDYNPSPIGLYIRTC